MQLFKTPTRPTKSELLHALLISDMTKDEILDLLDRVREKVVELPDQKAKQG